MLKYNKPNKRRRPGRPLDVEKRARILEVAHTMLLDKGPQASLEQIARAAGVSRQTIYNVWQSKAELIASVAEYAANHIGGVMFDSSLEGNLHDELHAFAQRYLDYSLSGPVIRFVRLLVVHGEAQPEIVSRIIATGPNEVYRQVARLLDRYIAMGTIRCADSLEAATCLCAMLRGPEQLRSVILGQACLSKEQVHGRAQRMTDLFLKAHDYRPA